MTFPSLIAYSDISLVILRIMIGIIFISSGWQHFTLPIERSKTIEMSPVFTFFLGMGEFFAALFIMLGIYVQISSLFLILIMGGAIYTKKFKWKIGFYDSKSIGWHYDLLILTANLVFFFTNGGKYVLWSP